MKPTSNLKIALNVNCNCQQSKEKYPAKQTSILNVLSK